jgi:multidrug efflux pump subunit AcrA (membrane-fusion protein)
MAETDVVNARPGQAAQIQLDALPNVAITGTVTLVSPYGTLTQGVVNYPVTIVLNNPPLGVDAGMSANINIITHQVSNALYVPNRAVEAGAWGLATTSAAPSATPAGTGKAAASGGTKPATRLQYVTVLTDGKQSQTAVQTGLSNNSMTQIVSGLTEGEIVLLNLPTTIAQQPKTTSSGSLGLPGVGRIPG